ncbi:MAG: hypothetical protein IPP94_12230 [Ignavibacteria bacterium]|nr:hypothetical protein [Ignavibacteria bacterium]
MDEINSGEGTNLRAVSFTDGNNGIAVGESGMLLKFDGRWWNQIRTTVGGQLYGVSFTDANIGTIVGSDGKILRTTNGGAN